MLGSGHLSIKKLQIQLAKSLPFRLVAVNRVTTNSGAKTPGLDKVLLISDTDKLLMVKTLKNLLIEAEKGKFKSSPVKRVMITKANGKLRPLGIPTMQDRSLQALIKLILEPIVEMSSDSNSYGFRPHRGAKNAIAAVRTLLQSGQESKWVLDADIKSFFDEINHN
jgi:RNA-directed DNA polymerase